MRSLRLLFTALLLISCLLPVAAQHALKGRVYDRDTKKPLRDVIVLFNFNNQQVLTDSLGRFSISNAAPRSSLLFKKLGYSSYKLALEDDSAGQSLVNVYMVKKELSLQEVEISAEKVAPVVKNKSFYIDDYFILPGRNFLLLAYFPGESGFSLVLATIHNKILSRMRFEHEEPVELFLDCVGNLHLVSDKYARQVVNTSDTTFSLLAPVPRGEFDQVVEPCVAKISKAYFFREYNKPGSFEREGVKVDVNSNAAMIYREQDRQKTPLRYIAYDKDLAKMQKEEVEYQNQREYLASISSLKYSPLDILFAYGHIYRKITAPVFLRNDTLVVFDFPNKEIALYNEAGTCVRKTPISPGDFPEFHESNILFDRVTSKLYVLSRLQNGQHLREVNVYTGKVGSDIRLENTLGTRLQVYDDDIYYILKEHDWDDTSYLYRQRQ